MDKCIELDAPNISNKEKEYLSRCIDTGFVSTFGPFVPRFEEEFARYINIKRAVAIQSGTAALHIALYELGIKTGDEVIVPALTFVATVNPVLYVGATPVFVDVDLMTWNISPKEIEKRISSRTKAILPVHLYGNPCNMDEIMKIARKYKLYVIEDASQSLGAKYKDRHTGTFGDLGCFSFNGNKIITTGGGGMVVGGDDGKMDHIKFLVNQARDESQGYYHPEVGFNYRMTNIEAALGIAQMERLVEFMRKKREFNRIFREELKGIKFIRFQEEYKGAESSCWLSCIIFEKDVHISALQKELREKGVPVRRNYVPVVEFPPYKRYKQNDYENSYYIYVRGLCLPGSTLNSNADAYSICKILKELI